MNACCLQAFERNKISLWLSIAVCLSCFCNSYHYNYLCLFCLPLLHHKLINSLRPEPCLVKLFIPFNQLCDCIKLNTKLCKTVPNKIYSYSSRYETFKELHSKYTVFHTYDTCHIDDITQALWEGTEGIIFSDLGNQETLQEGGI